MGDPNSLEDMVLSWSSQGSVLGEYLRVMMSWEEVGRGRAARNISEAPLLTKVLSLELSTVLASDPIWNCLASCLQGPCPSP